MKATLISILIAGVLIIAALVFTSPDGARPADVDDSNPNNVSFVEGKQIIEIDVVGGGYSPRISKAKANIPTVLRMNTTGFLSCAAALSIPAIKYRANLPLSGVTDIEIPPQEPGTSFRGLCAMGMYSFEILFEN
jgi:plastocyanin domain-containing protein